MAHWDRWFSQLETSIYKGFPMAMLNLPDGIWVYMVYLISKFEVVVFWNIQYVHDWMGLYKQHGDRTGYDGICVDDLISSYINSISWQADPMMWLLFRMRWAKLEKHVVWFAGCFEPFPWTKLSKDCHALSSWSILFCWELPGLQLQCARPKSS